MHSHVRQSQLGLGLAATVLTVWATLIVTALALDPEGALATVGFVAAVTFAYTGLFILGHDAMHGSLAPRWPRLNDAVGRLAVGLYALFSFRALRDAHHRHHAFMATPIDDPDFHDGYHTDLPRWYLGFMWRYLRWPQLLGMAIVFNLLHHGVGLPLRPLLLFWVLPSLLSTLQLFVIGTWLPHRHGPEHTHSLDLPAWAGFLACWNFGYHEAHHAYPEVPWWSLPAAHRRLTHPG